MKTSEDPLNRHLRRSPIASAGAELVFREIEKDEGLKMRLLEAERHEASEDRDNPAIGYDCTDLSPSDCCEFEDASPMMILLNRWVGRMIRSKSSEDITFVLA